MLFFCILAGQYSIVRRTSTGCLQCLATSKNAILPQSGAVIWSWRNLSLQVHSKAHFWKPPVHLQQGVQSFITSVYKTAKTRNEKITINWLLIFRKRGLHGFYKSGAPIFIRTMGYMITWLLRYMCMERSACWTPPVNVWYFVESCTISSYNIPRLQNINCSTPPRRGMRQMSCPTVSNGFLRNSQGNGAFYQTYCFVFV